MAKALKLGIIFSPFVKPARSRRDERQNFLSKQLILPFASANGRKKATNPGGFSPIAS